MQIENRSKVPILRMMPSPFLSRFLDKVGNIFSRQYQALFNGFAPCSIKHLLHCSIVHLPKYISRVSYAIWFGFEYMNDSPADFISFMLNVKGSRSPMQRAITLSSFSSCVGILIMFLMVFESMPDLSASCSWVVPAHFIRYFRHGPNTIGNPAMTSCISWLKP